MAHLIEDQFEQVIPNAAARGQQFLGVVQKHCQEAGIGLDLQPLRPSRKEDRVILEAHIKVGNWKRGARPLRLEVFADPIGSSLHVGYQVTKEVATGFLSNTEFSQRMQHSLDIGDADPANVRKINGMLHAFQATVFVPTLQMLVDSIQRAQAPQQGQGGFFGS